MNTARSVAAVQRRVAIVGAALSDGGRIDDKSEYELHFQGTSRALADAGLGKDDVDCFMSCGTGTLAPIDAWRAGACPSPAGSTQPM